MDTTTPLPTVPFPSSIVAHFTAPSVGPNGDGGGLLGPARSKTVEGITETHTRDLDAAVLLSSFANARTTIVGSGNAYIDAPLGGRLSNMGNRRVGLPAPIEIRREEPAPNGNLEVSPDGPQGVEQEGRERETTRETARRANEVGIRKEKRKWVKTYAQRCEAELPYIQAVFATYKVEQKMGVSVASIFREEFNSGHAEQSILSLVDCSLKTLRGLKCSRVPGSSTSIWATEEGKIQSRFRRKLAAATVEDANRVNYQITLGTGEVIEGNEKPAWLKGKTVTFADIREVPNRRESVAPYKKRRGLRDKPLTERRITEYAVEYLYKAISAALVGSKRRSNECVFNIFGYCFVPWSAHTIRAGSEGVNVNQGSMKFIFKTEDPCAWHN